MTDYFDVIESENDFDVDDFDAELDKMMWTDERVQQLPEDAFDCSEFSIVLRENGDTVTIIERYDGTVEEYITCTKAMEDRLKENLAKQ